MKIFLFRHGFAAFAALLLTLGFATTSSAQSAADPTGEAPIGIESKKEAKGPSLAGVLSVTLVNSNGVQADSATMVLRLRRGSLLKAFYAALPGPLFFETDLEKAQPQEDVLIAFHDTVLGFFFTDGCGTLGTGCPTVQLLLKQADEFGLTDDGVANQFVIMDVVVATSEPL
jgi:hypothetical protein